MGGLGFHGLKSLGRSFLEGGVPLVWPHPPPALFELEHDVLVQSDEDVFEPLRRSVSGGAP